MTAYLQKSLEKREKMKTEGRQGEGVVHDYQLEDYGLTEEVVRTRFKSYIQSFNL